VPNIFINDWLPRLSPAAVVVWLFGWREAFNPSKPGWTTDIVELTVTTIMAATGMSNKTVIKSLRELQSRQLLERTGLVKQKAQYRWRKYTEPVEKVHRYRWRKYTAPIRKLRKEKE